MKTTLLTVAVGTATLFTTHAQSESKIWKDYVNGKAGKGFAELPEFSYAGYHNSEKPLPTVKHKIFNIADYGAVPNDNKSDEKAIRAAIAAAEKNKSGVVFFPPGQFIINDDNDPQTPITIRTSNIVLRGSGIGETGTTVFMKNDLPPKNPAKMYSCPFKLSFSPKKVKDKRLGSLKSPASKGSRTIEISKSTKVKPGDWVYLSIKSKSSELLKQEMCSLEVKPEWKKLAKGGIKITEIHQVEKVEGRIITFVEPLHCNLSGKEWKLYSYRHLQEVGVENIHFSGNWKKRFKHHRSAQDDSGWSMLKFASVVNSWIKDSRISDVNRAVSINKSSATTVIDVKLDGNGGHNSVSVQRSTGILVARIDDTAKNWHASGVAGDGIGNVFWRINYDKNVCFETHASQPRNTLFDCVKGGFKVGHAGGAVSSLPNHMRGLVLWNYKEIGPPETNFQFWPEKKKFWKVVPPIIVGFHGTETTFDKKQVAVLESLGKKVKPESLFEAQLKKRLGKVPTWLMK